MFDNFKTLSKEEFEYLVNAIPLITILIGGADGELDNNEIFWAEKVTNIRSYNYTDSLKDFYTEVNQTFEEKLKFYLHHLPKDVKQRTAEITKELGSVNQSLKKLDSHLASDLYHSYQSFATHVAKASGGFLRFFSVNSEEKALLDLPMIDPIEFDEE